MEKIPCLKNVFRICIYGLVGSAGSVPFEKDFPVSSKMMAVAHGRWS